jgi:hypothetical protein
LIAVIAWMTVGGATLRMMRSAPADRRPGDDTAALELHTLLDRVDEEVGAFEVEHTDLLAAGQHCAGTEADVVAGARSERVGQRIRGKAATQHRDAGLVQGVLTALAARHEADDDGVDLLGDCLLLAVQVLVLVTLGVADLDGDVREVLQRQLHGRVGLRGGVGNRALRDVGDHHHFCLLVALGRWQTDDRRGGGRRRGGVGTRPRGGNRCGRGGWGRRGGCSALAAPTGDGGQCHDGKGRDGLGA